VAGVFARPVLFLGGLILDDVFQIGKIVNTQGLKGEMRVFPTTDDPHRFDAMKTVSLRDKQGVIEYGVERVRHQKNLVILKLVGIDDIAQAEKLRGAELIVPRAAALPLDAGEYYHKDLIGITVVTAEGETLGILHDILSTGANDVYEVRADETVKPLLIPAIRQCIINVDIPNRVMTVSLLEGLREL